jgi:hypothetical protein
MELPAGTGVRVASGGQVAEGSVESSAGKRVILRSPNRISPGSVVTLETPEALILGEVYAARPSGDGFEIGIELEQMIYQADLVRLARAVNGYS